VSGGSRKELLPMKKGDIYTAVEVTEEPGGVLIRTDAGDLLGVIDAKGVSVGDKIQIGPVCGDWCKVFLKGDAFRAQILQRSVKSS